MEEKNMENKEMQEQTEEKWYGIWSKVDNIDQFEQLKTMLKDGDPESEFEKLELAEDDKQWLNEETDDDSVRKHVNVLIGTFTETDVLKAIESGETKNVGMDLDGWQYLQKLFDAGFSLSVGRV